MLQIDKLTANRIYYFDGAMGTMLQALDAGGMPFPEILNIENPDLIYGIHAQYLKAGCDIIKTNTFGANCIKTEGTPFSADEAVAAGTLLACSAAKAFSQDKKRYVALDIGPTGKLLKPLGTLDFEDAVAAFGRMAKIGEENGADLVLIETMNDTYELKAAVLGAKENCSLPIIATFTLDEKGKLLTGGDIDAAVALLEALGVDALGINCGLGPKQIKALMPTLIECSSIPIVINPNAGIPKSVNGVTSFDVTPGEFAQMMAEIASMGVRFLGGCCGTTPAHIEQMIEATQEIAPAILTDKGLTVVSSYARAVRIGEKSIIIGERINPTGKKLLKEALRSGDYDYILGEAIDQQRVGAHILDVNAGLPDIDEAKVMGELTTQLQTVLTLPLQIDSSNKRAIETALRLYNGKALVNSVNGKKEVLADILPVVKKYGGVVVGLTLDENGIPDTANGRLAVAEKIIRTAAEYGISKKDIIIDTLTLTISSDQQAAMTTLQSLALIKRELAIKTILGVSNVSFGLPERETVNAAFYSLALFHGLDAAILNPGSEAMMRAYRTANLITGRDEQCKEYIAEATGVSQPVTTAKEELSLTQIILRGLKDRAYLETKRLLETTPPLEIIDNHLVAALNIMGMGFEKGEIFLPQLLMSAETVKNAFDAVKAHLSASGQATQSKGEIVVATVRGDIHDIGKNIVKTMLENYGFDVIDLGKDVPTDKIIEAVIKYDIRLVGLSALMTTTVPAMEEAIKEITRLGLPCKVMVGGAVLSQTYADMIKADYYAKDAMASVHYAQEIFG